MKFTASGPRSNRRTTPSTPPQASSNLCISHAPLFTHSWHLLHKTPHGNHSWLAWTTHHAAHQPCGSGSSTTSTHSCSCVSYDMLCCKLTESPLGLQRHTQTLPSPALLISSVLSSVSCCAARLVTGPLCSCTSSQAASQARTAAHDCTASGTR